MKSTFYSMTMKKTMLLFVSIFIIMSCSDEEEPIGKWDDIIKLSTSNVEFGAGTDSVTITTEGDWWWINDISFEDSTYFYYHREDLNLESDSYLIKEEGFIVERRDKNTLFVKLGENNTGKERILKITLEAGNYFDYVSIKQVAN